MRAILPGMTARLIDGTVTKVVDVLIDNRQRTVQYVVLGINGYFGPDVLAPCSTVWRVDNAVHLALTKEDLASLPLFDHYTHHRLGGLCSRSAWRYGTQRQVVQAPRPSAQ